MTTTDEVVLYDVADRIATVTLNRPEARNALNAEVRAALPRAVRRGNQDGDVDVIILTGADPAFCAGLDLKELGAGANEDAVGGRERNTEPTPPFVGITKPLIGAVNGVAITGGFELALNCDFLVASERAAFADTHARVGVMPGWGLTVLLPQAIGLRRAREMSLTGNFMGADEALQFGLVNRVVPHEDLLEVTRQIATDIVSNDQRGVRQILATYDLVSRTTIDEAWRIEKQVNVSFGTDFDPSEVERRRQNITNRGRSQV